MYAKNTPIFLLTFYCILWYFFNAFLFTLPFYSRPILHDILNIYYYRFVFGQRLKAQYCLSLQVFLGGNYDPAYSGRDR